MHTYTYTQNDLQAQARCHRIGQTKAVKIYRLITRRYVLTLTLTLTLTLSRYDLPADHAQVCKER